MFFLADHFYVTANKNKGGIVGTPIISDLQNLLTDIESKANKSEIESDTVATINEVLNRTFLLTLSLIKEKTDQGKFYILIMLFNRKTIGLFFAFQHDATCKVVC